MREALNKVRMRNWRRHICLFVTGLAISAGCATERSSSGKRGVVLNARLSLAPYLPDEKLAAPNTSPSFIVATPTELSLQPFYRDWLAAGGSTNTPPTSMLWHLSTQNSATLGWLKTSQVPIRVIVYLYAKVDNKGIPPEGSGKEYRCILLNSTSANLEQPPCTYRPLVHSGKPLIELATANQLDTNDQCYVIVNAAWIAHYSQSIGGATAEDRANQEVSASWGWRRCTT